MTTHHPAALRGIGHLVASPVLIMVAAWVALASDADLRSRIGMVLMGVTFAAIFSMSAVYHRFNGSAQWKRRLRQADHITIFIGMAGFYTALWLMALSGVIADALLIWAWSGAALGAWSKLHRIDSTESRHWLIYLVFAGAAVVVIPELVQSMGIVSTALILAGSFAALLGSVAYVTKRPNPWPGVFGYHEVFHSGTLVCAALIMLSCTMYVLR